MKMAKRSLAVLMAVAMLCGFMAFGVSAQEAAPTDAQMEELFGYLETGVAVSVMITFLYRVPRWLGWAVFSIGSSYEKLEAELAAELAKAGVSSDDVQAWMDTGEMETHFDDVLAYSKVMAEQGSALIKKHGVFYVDWIFDALLSFGGLLPA